MAKPNFTLPNKPAIKSGSILSYNYTDDFTFVPAPLTFNRDSSATRVNEKGLIETVGADQPRIDYLNDSNGALLLEPSRTNSLLQSNQFDNWIDSVTSVTSGYLGLDGTNSAWLLTKTASSSANIRQNITFSGIHTFSVYLKKGTNTSAILRSTGGNDARVEINLIDGTTSGAVNTTSVSTESMGNDWWRCSMTLNASSNTAVRIYPEAPLGGTTAGNIYMQYAQLEAGSYATSYIPTAGSTVTRLGETANNAGDVNVFNSEEGVLYAEIAALADDGTNRVLTLSNGGYNNSVRIQYYQTSNQLEIRVVSSGTLVILQRFTINDTTLFNKILVKYKLNDFAVWVNSSMVVSDTSGATPIGLSEISFDDGDGNYDFYGKVRNLQVFNKALTDRELEILTIQ